MLHGQRSVRWKAFQNFAGNASFCRRHRADELAIGAGDASRLKRFAGREGAEQKSKMRRGAAPP